MAAREAARDQETFGPSATSTRPKSSRFFDSAEGDATFEPHQRPKVRDILHNSCATFFLTQFIATDHSQNHLGFTMVL